MPRTKTNIHKASLRWVVKSSTYIVYDLAYLGKWRVFSGFYDAGRSKDETKKYKMDCHLPGINIAADYRWHETKEEAKIFAQKILNHWLKEAFSESAC